MMMMILSVSSGLPPHTGWDNIIPLTIHSVDFYCGAIEGEEEGVTAPHHGEQMRRTRTWLPQCKMQQQMEMLNIVTN